MADFDYKYTASALGYIQDIIKRMASNSFYIKGWSLSLSAIVIALIPKMGSTESVGLHSVMWVTGLSVVLVFIFSLLDAYYLQQERIFRNEYNKKVSAIKDADVMDSFKIISLREVKTCFCSVYFTISIVPYYLSIIACLIIGSIFI
ncbi:MULTISPECIES: hypothetical protein [Pectobacterium]|uniref:hypothetical protein n=1 Tax=Pectobacterium TaxID=122277 RepID=UPI001F10A4AB|nr:hypothetical protein [Pectobacterium aquaticum]MCH5049002.1 hypothetical protein [Pectobacterium aquaticum]